MKENLQFERKQNKQQLLEQIKSPKELFDFISKNIKYGFSGKDKKIYSPEIESWGVGESPAVIIQSTEDMLNSGYGMCWETTGLIEDWLVSHGYEAKSFLIAFSDKASQRSPAHSFVTFNDGEKWNWLETSLGDENGIYQFNSLSEIKDHVKKVISESALLNGATTEEIENCKVFEFKKPSAGNSGDDYLSEIMNHGNA